MAYICFGSFFDIIRKEVPQTVGDRDLAIQLLAPALESERASKHSSTEFPSLSATTISRWCNQRTDLRKPIKAWAMREESIQEAASHFDALLLGNGKVLSDLLDLDDLLEPLNFDSQERICSALLSQIRNDSTYTEEDKDELEILTDIDSRAFFLSRVFCHAIEQNNEAGTIEGRQVNIEDVAKGMREVLKQASQLPLEKLAVPAEPAEDELTYVSAILSAYAEVLGCEILNKSELNGYERYLNHFERCRRSYYDAEAIRRGTRDMCTDDDDPFATLEDETYDSIIDIYDAPYTNGYARLQAVLNYVSTVTLSKSILCHIPSWIGVNEKKGICHMLVSDKRLDGWCDNANI